MALAFEKNTSLAFDTDVFKVYGKKYGEIATSLREMASDLDKCLAELAANGWTTPAGSAFYKFMNTGWRVNIEKYASLLDTLESILSSAATQYDDLVYSHIEKTEF